MQTLRSNQRPSRDFRLRCVVPDGIAHWYCCGPHSSLGPDMPSASGNLTCAAVVTITMIEPHLDRRALRSVDSWAAQSLAMREAPISGATRPHFTANFGKANTSSPGDLFVPNFFGVCAGYGPVLARTYTCSFSGALPQHLPVLQHAPTEHRMIRSPGD